MVIKLHAYAFTQIGKGQLLNSLISENKHVNGQCSGFLYQKQFGQNTDFCLVLCVFYGNTKHLYFDFNI